MVGRAEYDELGFWLDQINLLGIGESVSLILNERLILKIYKTVNSFDLAVYSGYNVNKKRQLVEINASRCLYQQNYDNNKYIDMDNYIDYLFGKYVKSVMNVRDIASGIVGTISTLTILTALTCAAACY